MVPARDGAVLTDEDELQLRSHADEDGLRSEPVLDADGRHRPLENE
jgi:hypothetical protein